MSSRSCHEEVVPVFLGDTGALVGFQGMYDSQMMFPAFSLHLYLDITSLCAMHRRIAENRG